MIGTVGATQATQVVPVGQTTQYIVNKNRTTHHMVPGEVQTSQYLVNENQANVAYGGQTTKYVVSESQGARQIVAGNQTTYSEVSQNQTGYNYSQSGK